MRASNPFISGLVDVIRALRKAISNNHILVFGALQVGKSTFQKHILMDSTDFRLPEKTGAAGKVESYKIDYLGDSYDSFKVKIQDVAGDRIHWADTIRRIVNFRPPVIIFMLRAFELRDDNQDIKKTEHLMRVKGLIESFRIMKVDTMLGTKEDIWYCGEDMDAFKFLSTLIFNTPNLYTNYPDIMSKCTDIHQKLFKNRSKIIPKYLYVVVNFVDLLPDDEISPRIKAVLKPYQSLLMRWSDGKVRIRRMGISARFGKNIEKLLKAIGEDRRWT